MEQERFLALVPKFTASLGLPSALFIISEVIRSHRKGEGNPILRSIMFVSFYEALDALGWFLSSWAVPRGTFAWATGTQATCNFQGFLLQFVIGAPLNNCALAVYFFLAAKQFTHQMAHFEKAFVTIVFLYAFGTGISFMIMDLYNPIGAVCWVYGSPADCSGSTFRGGGDIECERGEDAWFFGMVFFYLPIWICVVVIVCLNIVIYGSLRGSGEEKWFAQQSIMYALAFCLTWAPSTTWSAMHWNNGPKYGLDVASAFFEPLAGFWNLLIFLRNRPASRKRLIAILSCRFQEAQQDEKESTNTDSKEESKDREDKQEESFREEEETAKTGGADIRKPPTQSHAPKLETVLMQKFRMHYAEVRTVVDEERNRLGMSRSDPVTLELQEACEEICDQISKHESSHH